MNRRGSQIKYLFLALLSVTLFTGCRTTSTQDIAAAPQSDGEESQVTLPEFEILEDQTDGPQAPIIGYAEPPDPTLILAQAIDPSSGRALVVGQQGAVRTYVTEVCMEVRGSSATTCVAPDSSGAFSAILGSANAGDLIDIWTNASGYLAGGPGLNSIPETVQYWFRRFPKYVGAYLLTSDGLYMGSNLGLYFVPAAQLNDPLSTIKITQAQGLPPGNIIAMANGSNGDIWLSVRGGLGDVVALLQGAPSSPKVINNTLTGARSVHNLLSDPIGGGVWAATNIGLVHLRKSAADTLDVATLTDASQGNPITALAYDPSGSLWLGRNFGEIYNYDPRTGATTPFALPSSFPQAEVHQMSVSPSGDLAVATSGGIAYLRAGNTILSGYTMADGLPEPSIADVTFDPVGNVWFATSNSGVGYFEKDKAPITVRSIPKTRGLPYNRVPRIFSTSGSIWLSSWEGPPMGNEPKPWFGEVSRITLVPGEAEVSTLENGTSLPDNLVKGLSPEFDGAGNLSRLWAVTGNGLASMSQMTSNAEFSILRAVDGLSSDWLRAVAVDSKHGRTWVGTDDRGLNLLTPSGSGYAIRQITREEGLRSNRISALAVSANGDLWVGQESDEFTGGNGGLSHVVIDSLGKISVTSYSVADGLPSAEIHSLSSDSSGILWVGTIDGLARVDTNTSLPQIETIPFYQYNPTGHGLNSIQTVLSDGAGGVWVGIHQVQGHAPTSRAEGLDHLVPSGAEYTITHYSSANGLGSDVVTSLAKDANGMLWVGTEWGVYELHEVLGVVSFEIHSTSTDLPSNHIRSLAAHPLGGMFVGTDDGLLYIPAF